MARAMPKAVVAGESLQSRLDSGERFGQAQLLNLLRGVGDELADAHRAARFHGSITPADIRFDSAGEIALDGWGRDTTPDAMRASRYAPVECYAPVHPQGPWTDVYALGAVLWCAITAEPLPEVLHRKGDVTLSRLAPAGFDPAFLASVDAALEIAPQRRPQSVEQWLAMFGPVPRQPAILADPPASEPDAAAPAANREAQAAAPEKAMLPWPFRQIWPVAATAVAAVVGALWATSPPEAPSEPAGNAPPASLEPAVAVAEEAPPAPVATPDVVATGTSPVEAPVATAAVPAAPAPTPRLVAKAETVAAPPKAPPPPAPVVVEQAPPEPQPAPEPEATGGEAPRALLARADKRLRRLFGDYARLRAEVEDSYHDNDVPHAVKRRAYREGLQIQRELVELRDVRNRIARTGDFQTANRRYDSFEASAAQIGARIDELRRDF